MNFTGELNTVDAMLRWHVDVPLNHGKVGVASIKATRHGLGGKLEGVSKILDRAS